MPKAIHHINPVVAATDTTTIHQDSVAAVPRFVPKYPNGIPNAVGNNLPVTEVSHLPVMELPKGRAGESFIGDYNLDSGIMLLTIISFFLVSVSFRHSVKHFLDMLRNPFSIRTRENVFEDRTINETFYLTTLIANTCIAQGILLYYAIENMGFIDIWQHRVLLPVLICIGVSTCYYIFQFVLYNLLGYVFGTHELTKIWLESFNSSQTLFGVVLIPVVLMLNIHAGDITFLLILGLIPFVLLRILFISKGFRIFFNKIELQIYFILYLCAVEIVPVFLCIIGSIFLCNVLQA